MGRFGDPACSILLRSANKAGIFSKKLHLERTFKTTERVDAFETGAATNAELGYERNSSSPSKTLRAEMGR